MIAPVFFVFGRYTLRVAYSFSTNNAHYILSNMILPQLEAGNHGFEVAGMFFIIPHGYQNDFQYILNGKNKKYFRKLHSMLRLLTRMQFFKALRSSQSPRPILSRRRS